MFLQQELQVGASFRPSQPDFVAQLNYDRTCRLILVVGGHDLQLLDQGRVDREGDRDRRHGVAAETIAKLSTAVHQFHQSGGGDERERWYRAIADVIPTGAAIRAKRERLALVGPAGVGKTASLIKLTVFETQRRACRVSRE